MSAANIINNVVDIMGVVASVGAVAAAIYVCWAQRKYVRKQMEKQEKLANDKFRAFATLYYWGKSTKQALVEQLGDNFNPVMDELYENGMVWQWHPDEPDRIEYELSTKGKRHFEDLRSR